MAEIVEYALVITASMLLVGGSAVVYSTYQEYLVSLQARASFAALVTSADEALVNGSTTSSLYFPTGTLQCLEGNLSFSSASGSFSSAVPADCNFSLLLGGGTKTYRFVSNPPSLELGVG
ncbi:MAG: hypothetical protein HY247_02220 [archaeon]|nr:MAG: hypothetical protein HY247_02220 [archaeon]